jgi:hypothetical protein
MSRMPSRFAFGAAILLMGACSSQNSSESTPRIDPVIEPAPPSQAIGLVRFIDLEGGAWVVEAETGAHAGDLLLDFATPIPQHYRQEGLRLEVVYDDVADQPSVLMFENQVHFHSFTPVASANG